MRVYITRLIKKKLEFELKKRIDILLQLLKKDIKDFAKIRIQGTPSNSQNACNINLIISLVFFDKELATALSDFTYVQ